MCLDEHQRINCEWWVSEEPAAAGGTCSARPASILPKAYSPRHDLLHGSELAFRPTKPLPSTIVNSHLSERLHASACDAQAAAFDLRGSARRGAVDTALQ